jgi:predicted TIM-barrel fold metal-dependent hydrolase
LKAQTPPPGNKLGFIDLHHHILPPAFMAGVRDYMMGAWRVAGRQQILPPRMLRWSPQNALAEMDRNGVRASIVSFPSPAISPDSAQSARAVARRINEYAAQLARDYPGRFGLFATVPLPDTEGSLQEISYALDVLKADGIGLMSSYGDKWPGDPIYAPVLEELNRRNAVVYFHPYVPTCCSALIPNAPYVLTELPHDTTRAITSLLFSALYALPRDSLHFCARWRHGSDARRPHFILFGTDYPAVPIGDTVEDLTRLGLPAADLQAIGRDNALTLLPRFKA